MLIVLPGAIRSGLLLGSLLGPRVEVRCGVQSVTGRGCDPSHTNSALSPWTNLTGESDGWSCQTCSGTRAGSTCPSSRSDQGPGPPAPIPTPTSPSSFQSLEEHTVAKALSVRVLQTWVQSPAVVSLLVGPFRCSTHLPANWFCQVFPQGC